MRFDNFAVRRQDRLLDRERAMELLREGEYGVLSLVGRCDGGMQAGYGVPMNYVLSGDSVFFHCAPEGRKLDYARRCPGAGFCVVGRTQVRPGEFTTGYRSVMVSGTLSPVGDRDRKWEALKAFLRKYSPDHYAAGVKYCEASLARVAVLELVIETVSGKTKEVRGEDGR